MKASDLEKQWGEDLERRGVFDKPQGKSVYERISDKSSEISKAIHKKEDDIHFNAFSGEKSVVEDWEKEIKANGHNWIQQDKMIPFIKNLQKETDEKSYERGLEDGRGIEKRLNAEKLKETDDKWRKRIEDLMEWIELMDWECFEQTQIKKDILDQATNIIKEVTAS
jgi:hypothetical protein